MNGGVFENMLSFWRVYQIKIIHQKSFQKVFYCLIYIKYKNVPSNRLFGRKNNRVTG
jgi:hypothetical protein